MTRDPGAGSRDPKTPPDPVTAALQAYADRGVFRGFQAASTGRGRTEYRFLWLTKKPMTAVFDARMKKLTFPSVLPQVDRQTAAALTAVIDARSERRQPNHKRIDARKARISGGVRRGDLSLIAEIRGSNHDYAVSKALNLINELFVMLHEHHPDYLVERFDISTE